MKTYRLYNYSGVAFPYLINNYGNIHTGGNDKGTVYKEGVIDVNSSISVDIDLPEDQYCHFNLFKYTEGYYCISIYAGDMYPDASNIAVYRLNEDIEPDKTNVDSVDGGNSMNNAILKAYITDDDTFNVTNMDKEEFIVQDNGKTFCKKNPIEEDYSYIVAVKNPEGTFGITGEPSTKESCGSNISWIIILIIIVVIIAVIIIVGGGIVIYVKKKKSTT